MLAFTMDVENLPTLDLTEDIPQIPCNYYNVKSFKKHIEKTKNCISVLTYNIRSCRKNFASFVTFLSMSMLKFTFLILCETWLTDDVDFGFDLDGYNQFNIYRNVYGGGIKLFYDERVSNVKLLDNFTLVNDFIEIITCIITVSNVRYVICAIYRSPASSASLFNHFLFNEILSSLPRDCRVIIAGDINLNLFNPYGLNCINNYMNGLLELGYFPINKIAAKINDSGITRYSLIDQIWANFHEGCFHSAGVVEFPLTDHFPVFYLFNKGITHGVKTVKNRIITDNSINDFIQAVSNTPFNDIFVSDDPSHSFDSFYYRLISLYERIFPVKKKRVKIKDLNEPWISSKLRRCIKKKHYLYSLMKRGLISKRSFNIYKNMLRMVTKKAKSLYIKSGFTLNNNIRNIWSNINVILKRSTRNEDYHIKSHTGENLVGVKMCNYINNYFACMVSEILINFPSNVSNVYLGSLPVVYQSCMFFPTHFIEIVKILKNMKDKGNALYEFKPSLIFKVHQFIIPILVEIYNKCIVKGVYPSCLKVARVVPIYKKGDREKTENYRPISNLNVFNKIYERLTYDRIYSFLEKQNILSNLQYGFMRNSNTTLAIFHLVNDLLKTFNEKKYTFALFIDFKKAFDTVDREILLRKLNLYGFRGEVNDFLRSYLSDRKQYVNCGNFTSETCSVDVGVPQGSILGPLLFNIFINDITLIPDCNKILYADDAVFYVTDSDFSLCLSKLWKMIKSLEAWIGNNRLLVNTGKTKLMLFTSKQFAETLPDVQFDGAIIEWVTSITYLGFILDNNLNFNLHFQKVIKSLSKFSGIFYSINNFIPEKTLINIYNALVLPHIQQNIIIWGCLPQNQLNEINVRMNRILRLILRVRFDNEYQPSISTDEMYRRVKTLKFNDMYKLYILKFLHFCKYTRLDIFNTNFSHLLPEHDYPTRNTRIRLPAARLDVEKRGTIFQSCKLLNSLDESLLKPQSAATLGKKFKLCCIEKYGRLEMSP